MQLKLAFEDDQFVEAAVTVGEGKLVFAARELFALGGENGDRRYELPDVSVLAASIAS